MSKKMCVLFVLLLVIVSLATLERSLVVHGSPDTLSPTADSWVNSNAANDNYGSDTLLQVQYQAGKIRRAFIKFDLTSLPANILITSAKLYLYRDSGDAASQVIGAYKVSDDSWTEATITWNNAPAHTTLIGSVGVGPSSAYYSWDVTSVASLEFSGDKILSLCVRLVDETSNQYQVFVSKEGTSGQRPYLEVTYTFLPTNDALTLDLTGASYKGTKTLLCTKQDYKFVYKCSDANGVTDISYAEIRLDPAGKNVILRATRGAGDTWTFSEQSDPNNYVTLNTDGSSHSTSGNQKTFNFLVQINWNWGDSAETITVRAYVIDSAGASDTDDYANVFGVEAHLTAYSLSVNDYRCDPSQTLTFSGYWYYDGTSIAPPDGDYQVKVKRSGVQKGSTDITLASGAFSISDVTAEATVGSYSYTIEATYMFGAGSFSAVIVDRVKVIGYSVSDSRANINDDVNTDATLKYEYDNTAVTDGSVTINGVSATHQGSGVWRITQSKSTVQAATYNTVAASGNAHGITTVNQNSQSVTVVWDRLEVYGYSTSDDRADVGYNVEYRWQLRYDYDDVIFDNTKGSVTIGGVSATWDAVNSRWYRSVTLPSTPQSYSQALGFTDNTYGLTVITGTTSQSVIADRLELWWVGFDDSRVNVGATAEVRFKVRYDYDDVVFDDTKGVLNIEGGSATWDVANGWWKRSIVQSSSVGSNLYDVNDLTFIDSTYGLTAIVGTASGSVITDRIRIDSIGVVDGRIDINTQGTFYATASLEYDDHALGSGDSLTANFGALTWDATNSWFDGVRSQATVGSHVFTVNSGNEATYGITTICIVVSNPTGIWDRLEIVSVTFDDNRINVGGTAEVRYVLRYDYDDVTFDNTKGSVTGFTWDATNGWWDKSITGSSSVGSENYDETDFTFTDTTYGIKVKEDVAGANIITDRIRILTLSAIDSRVNINTAITFYATADLEYDSHALGSGDSFTLSGHAFSWNVGNNRFEATDTKASVQAVTINTFTSGSEATYGITVGNINSQTVTGVWDRIKITGMGNDDGRRDAGTTGTFWATAVLEYDTHALGSGDSLTISGKAMSWIAGNNRFEVIDSSSTVQAITYNAFTSGNEATYGITAGAMNGYSTTIIWDRFEFVLIEASYTRINAGGTFELRYKIRYDYDDVTFDNTKGSITGFTWDAVNNWWKKTVTGSSSVMSTNYDETYVSITDSTYGLTAKQDVAGANVITDRIKITMTPSAAVLHVEKTVEVTVSLTYDFDGSPATSYSYSINRNGTAYNNPHTSPTFTDSKDTAGRWVYDFTGVIENTYGITAFVDPPDVAVEWVFGDFSIRVLDTNGYAIINSKVEIYNGTEAYWMSLYTNATGLVSVEDAPCQNYKVKIYWQDALMGSLAFNLDRASISITYTCPVYYGYVRVYESSGTPILGAMVGLIRPDGTVYGTYRTDATGSTPLIPQVPAGSYILQTSHGGAFLSTTITVNQNFDIQLLLGQLSIPYENHVSALAYITNTEVKSYTYSQTFRSLLIAVECSEEPSFFSVFLTDTFLSQLGITIDDVHTLLDGELIGHTVDTYPGGYLLTITHSICSPHDIEISFSSVTLVATLTDSNAIPLDGALVRACRGQALIEEGYTNGSGRIVFTSLPSGHYTISTFWLGVPVRNDQLTMTDDTTYEAAYSVYALGVQVTDAFSESLPGSSVTIYLPDGTVLTSGLTDQDGAITFHQLPIGHYTVVSGYFGFSNSATVNLTENSAVQIQVPMLNIDTLFMLTIPPILGFAFYGGWRKKERKIRVLFVDSYNLDRSRTAEEMYEDREDIDVKSAGILPGVPTPITEEMVNWADKIFVMEKKHRDHIIDKYPEAKEKTITLNIKDKYQRNDPALKRILEKKNGDVDLLKTYIDYKSVKDYLQERRKLVSQLQPERAKVERKRVADLDKEELEVLKLLSEKKTVMEIALRLMKDPDQIEKRINKLKDQGFLNPDSSLTRRGLR